MMITHIWVLFFLSFIDEICWCCCCCCYVVIHLYYWNNLKRNSLEFYRIGEKRRISFGSISFYFYFVFFFLVRWFIVNIDLSSTTTATTTTKNNNNNQWNRQIEYSLFRFIYSLLSIVHHHVLFVCPLFVWFDNSWILNTWWVVVGGGGDDGYIILIMCQNIVVCIYMYVSFWCDNQNFFYYLKFNLFILFSYSVIIVMMMTMIRMINNKTNKECSSKWKETTISPHIIYCVLTNFCCFFLIFCLCKQKNFCLLFSIWSSQFHLQV